MIALSAIPVVAAGDDLVDITVAALDRMGLRLENRDVLVYAQKLVSKAEGRLVDLRSIVPGERARTCAREVCKYPLLG